MGMKCNYCQKKLAGLLDGTRYCSVRCLDKDRSRQRRPRPPRKSSDAEKVEMRRWHLSKKYGMTPEQYNEMLAKQEGRCAICLSVNPGKGKKHFCVDHNHDTSKVRGLLCCDCNRALGLFRDSPKLLVLALTYLNGEKS